MYSHNYNSDFDREKTCACCGSTYYDNEEECPVCGYDETMTVEEYAVMKLEDYNSDDLEVIFNNVLNY